MIIDEKKQKECRQKLREQQQVKHFQLLFKINCPFLIIFNSFQFH